MVRTEQTARVPTEGEQTKKEKEETITKRKRDDGSNDGDDGPLDKKKQLVRVIKNPRPDPYPQESLRRIKEDSEDESEHARTPLTRAPVTRRKLSNIPPTVVHNSSSTAGGTWDIVLQNIPITLDNLKSILNLQQTCHLLSESVRSLRPNFWQDAYFEIYSPKKEDDDYYLPRYGEFWDSAFVHPKLSITTPNCWKNRLLHRLWLQRYRTPLRDIKRFMKANYELKCILENPLLLKNIDCFTISDDLIQEPYIGPGKHTTYIVLIGPTTLPIYFRLQYEAQGSRFAYDDGDWFFQLTAYSFRAHAWKPFSSIYVCLCCEEDEGEEYPVRDTLASLVWGFKTADLTSGDEIPEAEMQSFEIHNHLRGILIALSAVPEEQWHANTNGKYDLVDSDEEILE